MKTLNNFTLSDFLVLYTGAIACYSHRRVSYLSHVMCHILLSVRYTRHV